MKRCITIETPKDDWNGLLIVGEAPGEKEEEKGKPFVGISGQVLNRWLEKAKIVRSECIITNVFHIRPENNQIGEFFCSAKIAQEQELTIYPWIPNYHGQYCFEPYTKELTRLKGELKKHKPRAIISVGSVALWALTGDPTFGRRLFNIQGCKLWSHGIVLPLYHPSYWMRKGRDPIIETETIQALKKVHRRVKRLMVA